MALLDGNGLSAADIAAVTGNGNGFGFGNDGAWWLIILFLFFMNNGWGNNGYSNPVQNGFDQQALLTGIGGVQNSICSNQADLLQAINSVSMGLQNCCCENRASVADLKYTVANEGAATRAAIQSSVQVVLDKMCQQEIDALKAQNANLQTQLNIANMQASQTAQTAKILADNAAQTVALEQYLNPNCCANNWYQACGCGA